MIVVQRAAVVRATFVLELLDPLRVGRADLPILLAGVVATVAEALPLSVVLC